MFSVCICKGKKDHEPNLIADPVGMPCGTTWARTFWQVVPSIGRRDETMDQRSWLLALTQIEEHYQFKAKLMSAWYWHTCHCTDTRCLPLLRLKSVRMQKQFSSQLYYIGYIVHLYHSSVWYKLVSNNKSYGEIITEIMFGQALFLSAGWKSF